MRQDRESTRRGRRSSIAANSSSHRPTMEQWNYGTPKPASGFAILSH
jgi:hypothetical protein